MTGLHLKIPPPLVFVVFLIAMYLAAMIDNGWWYLYIPFKYVWVAIFAVTGTVFGGMATLAFVRHRTSLDPRAVTKASCIVTTGVFSISRNPMYLTLLFLLLAWGVWLEDGISLLLTTLFVPYINRFQIVPEELALAEKFGSEYLDYKAKVRRWI
ncbi:methyltransferase family protein [Vibrio hippocampi]|uniref:Isoprenylcysteine carboxylmethyltransferase family protein n=1 Tax=Vibrio hippocampi TaxID=654686 RepID=A0ABN8DJ55_9VIBR|nr:isoprenylcysteine carboxylmethyltransferase family protein [Vibrio hippocampi]CAH0525831.1 hypothetical protein VHP8226_01356 [Vibrio hippocampi]